MIFEKKISNFLLNDCLAFPSKKKSYEKSLILFFLGK